MRKEKASILCPNVVDVEHYRRNRRASLSLRSSGIYIYIYIYIYLCVCVCVLLCLSAPGFLADGEKGETVDTVYYKARQQLSLSLFVVVAAAFLPGPVGQ